MDRSDDQPKARTVVSAKALRARMREEILTVCDFRRSVGRLRHSVLGNERTQMDVNVACRILSAVLDELSAAGGVLEPSLETLIFATGRRDWCRKLLLSMAAIRTGVVSAIPAELISKSLGDLIKVGKGPGNDAGKKREMRYVRKDGATVIELTACFNIERKRFQELNSKFNNLVRMFSNVLPAMPPGVSIEEYYASSVRDYYAAPVNDGPSLNF